MKPDIVHVVTGASFVDFVARSFDEVVPGRSLFVGVGVAPEKLRLPDDVRVEALPYGPAATDRLNRLVAQSRIAIFHNVQNPVVAALAAAPKDTLRVWSGWGGDYYGSDIDVMAGLIGRRTRSYVRGNRGRSYWPDRLIELARVAPVRRAAARAADVFSAPIREDLEVFRKRFRGFNGCYSQLNYASVEDTISIGPDRVIGSDILLGNSATPENNHLEVLEGLSRQALGESRIYAPLNYGDGRYAVVVAKRGHELFGDQFVPITEPLSLEQYHQVMARCSVVVMGHRRQQGLGNILRALWQGAHVVLDRRNPVAGSLTERGAEVEVLGVADIGRLAASPPSPAQVLANRAMLTGSWSRRVVLKNIENLVSLAK